MQVLPNMATHETTADRIQCRAAEIYQQAEELKDLKGDFVNVDDDDNVSAFTLSSRRSAPFAASSVWK